MISVLVNWGYELRDRYPGLGVILARVYQSVRWLNQFRHHARKTINGLTYELDLSEDIDSTIYFKESFEPDTVSALRSLACPGDVAFDVGANMGWHTLLLATLVGETGRVVAFEPIQWACLKLARNLSLNPKLLNVKLENVAVSANSSAMQEVSFRASWQTFGHQDGIFTNQVEVITLDDYVQRSGVPRVCLMKVDVDGYEGRIISGASSILRRFRPALIMEVSTYCMAAIGDNLASLAANLTALGYAIFDERTKQEFVTYEQLEAAIPDHQTINVVCLHREDLRLPRWLGRDLSSRSQVLVSAAGDVSE